MKKVNIAVIGAGIISQAHLKAIKVMEDINLLAVSDIIKDKAQLAAEKIWCQML